MFVKSFVHDIKYHLYACYSKVLKLFTPMEVQKLLEVLSTVALKQTITSSQSNVCKVYAGKLNVCKVYADFFLKYSCVNVIFYQNLPMSFILNNWFI